jgi:hypothetical protein
VARRRGAAVRAARLVALLATAVSLIGCSSAPEPSPTIAATPGPNASILAASPTPRPWITLEPTPVPPPTPTPAPTAPPVGDSFAILPAPPQAYDGSLTCTGSIGATDPVASVSLKGGDTGLPVIRDYADIAHPRTVCNGGGQFIDAQHLLISETIRTVDPSTGAETDSPPFYAVVDLPAVRFHWFQLPVEPHGDTDLLAVSPDRNAIAWRVINGGPNAEDVIHVTTASGDKIIASLPDTNPGRCAAPTDSNNAAYTRSGSALFVLDEPLPEISLLVVKGGTIVLSSIGKATAAPASRPTKALWSPNGETLYYVQNGSVWGWTQALGRVEVLPGVSWDVATISPDGAHLAYSVTGPTGQSNVYLVGLAAERRANADRATRDR